MSTGGLAWVGRDRRREVAILPGLMMALGWGGAVSAEHGIGKLKKPLLQLIPVRQPPDIEAREVPPAPYKHTSLEDSLRSGKPHSQAREKKE